MLHIKKQKGQSIVGYALILAFAAALAVLFYTDDMRGAFQTVYAKLEMKLGAGAGDVMAYRSLSSSQLRNIDNQQRIAIDQQSLQNLGSRFLGLTKNQLRNLLNNSNIAESNLYYNGSQTGGVLLFDYRIENEGENNNQLRTRLLNTRVDPNAMVGWLQGDYSVAPVSGNDKRFSLHALLSDDVLNYKDTDISYKQANVSARATFTFLGNEDTIDSVRLWVTKCYQDPETNQWIVQDCEGLSEVMLYK